ncbi:hypothetical protein CJ030_MR0G020158 [Morella rubra]|uniref:GRF-type domain-containing protein n=1 Tax=Morella rubra TaxID=262757 RepID=A0A6A1UKC6_9ROSI|nr:hypothetical protein CJ030_MR0G020158 [Morella rubra]
MASQCNSPPSPSTASSATSIGGDSTKIPICYCGVESCLKTAYTEANFGRRFFSCVNHKFGRSCGFFMWFDPPMCIHGRRVLSRIRERHERTRVEIEIESHLKTKEDEYAKRIATMEEEYGKRTARMEEEYAKCSAMIEHNMARLRLELVSTKYSHNDEKKFYRRMLTFSWVLIVLLLLPSMYVTKKEVGVSLPLAP